MLLFGVTEFMPMVHLSLLYTTEQSRVKGRLCVNNIWDSEHNNIYGHIYDPASRVSW